MFKKLIYPLLMLALLFGFYSQAQAKGPGPSDPIVNIIAPQKAEPGQAINVALTNNISRTATKIDVVIFFPKTTVTSVELISRSKNVRIVQGMTGWTAFWKQEVKPRQAVRVDFKAVLVNRSGKMMLVDIKNPRGVGLVSRYIQIAYTRPTIVPSATATATKTREPFPTPPYTATPSPTATMTNTATPTETATPTATNTPEPTFTSTPSQTATWTASPTPTQTATATAVPELVWYASVPNVYAGHDKFVSTISAVNSAGVDQELAVTVKVLFNDGNDQSVVFTPYCKVGTYVKVIQKNDLGMTVEWHGLVPAGGNCQLSIENGSGDTSGTFDYLEVRNILGLSVGSEGTIFLSAPVTVLPKEVVVPLVLTASSPDSVVYGGRAIKIELTMSNPNNSAQPFDVTTNLVWTATDRGLIINLTGGSYNFFGDPTGAKIPWSGTIPGHESYTMTIETKSSAGLGAFDLFTTSDTATGQIMASRQITLTKGTELPYGVINLKGIQAQDGQLVAGQMAAYEPEFFAPNAGQFWIHDVHSTCQIDGLPTGAISPANLTYVKYLYYVSIAPMEKPEGVTDPYYVTCQVSAMFYQLGLPGDYVVWKDFQVLVP